MAIGAKSYVLNRRDDWEERSVLYNFAFDGDDLVSQNTSGENAVYISSAFDSMQAETVWHRLRLDADIPQNTQVKVRVYASDSLNAMLPGIVMYGDDPVPFDEHLMRKDIAPAQKIAWFDYLGAKVFENPSDVVLYQFTGRYLWICIETISYSEEIARFKNLKIEFPRMCFVEYLPQIYRGGIDKNTFLSRFISVFQSLYIDLEDKIDNIPQMFDPKTVDPQFLTWLTEWFSIKDNYLWETEKLREILDNAVRLYKIKGTKQAISEIVKLYVGVEPIIVEQFDVVNNDYYDRCKEHIEKLFGKNSYTFSVIVKPDKTITSEEYVELIRVINSFKPIDSICNLVILNSEMYLDHHCYLGINSCAAQNQYIVLDENTTRPNLVYISEEGEH